MAEKIFEDDELFWIRVQCDCLSAEHAIDFTVETAKDGKVVYIGLSEFKTWRVWRQRIKGAWDVLKGKEILIDDRGLREEDIPAIIEVLRKAL